MNKLNFFLTAGMLLLALGCKKDSDISDTPTPAGFILNWEKAWGTEYADDFSGAVIDASGYLYFTGTSQPDGYAADIFLTKINLADQSLMWAKSYDMGDMDFQPSPSENGHSQGGGGPRCIALDDAGNIYIAGTSRNGFNEVFVAKVDAGGTLLWSRFWEADSSGLARGAAKAFALDVANNKVYLTGSSGSGVATEEAMVFLLVLDAASGDVDPLTVLGMDPSPTYNDRGYTIRISPGNDIYIAGWQGNSNSGFLMKLSGSTANLLWYEKVDIGSGARITDLDFDASGNLYLSADLRGVSSYLGVIKMDGDGNVLWAEKMQGEANDRNNISCLSVLNNILYVGGKGSYTGYDLSQYSDGCYYKFDLNGNLIKQYNYFTGNETGNRCGERIESILHYNGKLILAGETWPEGTQIHGQWYEPNGTISNLEVSCIRSFSMNTLTGDGAPSSRTLTISDINRAVYNPGDGSQGGTDIIMFGISE